MRGDRRSLLRILVVGAALGSVLAACSPESTRDDTGPAQERRKHTVERLLAGDLAVEGPAYEVLSHEPLTVFFKTWSGMSPDPYCGYEYAADPTAVEPDPHGSGHGEVEAIGGGWSGCALAEQLPP